MNLIEEKVYFAFRFQLIKIHAEKIIKIFVCPYKAKILKLPVQHEDIPAGHAVFYEPPRELPQNKALSGTALSDKDFNETVSGKLFYSLCIASTHETKIKSIVTPEIVFPKGCHFFIHNRKLRQKQTLFRV